MRLLPDVRALAKTAEPQSLINTSQVRYLDLRDPVIDVTDLCRIDQHP